jgi:uncharacterized protein
MEHRSVTGDVQGTVTDIDERRGQFLAEIPFFRTDTYKTQWVPSSFRESWDRAERTGHRFPVLWQHDMADPIGVVTRTQITHRAGELTAQLSNLDDVPSARRAYSQLKEGHVSGISFGFERQHETPHPEERGVMVLDKVAFRELSAVTMPSVPGARVLSVRSQQAAAWTVEQAQAWIDDDGIPMMERNIAGVSLYDLLREWRASSEEERVLRSVDAGEGMLSGRLAEKYARMLGEWVNGAA